MQDTPRDGTRSGFAPLRLRPADPWSAWLEMGHACVPFWESHDARLRRLGFASGVGRRSNSGALAAAPAPPARGN